MILLKNTMIESLLKDRLKINSTKSKDGMSFVLSSGSSIVFNNERLTEALNDKKIVSLPKLLLVSGESESGKSTFGQFGLDNGLANRVKIYKIIANLQEAGLLPQLLLPPDQQTEMFKFDPLGVATAISGNPKLQSEASEKIINEFIKFHRQTDALVDVVETIKHPWIVEDLKSAKDLFAISVFVKAPEHSRILRESIRKDVPVGLIAEKVKEKDDWKNSMGNLVVESNADITIHNSGSKDDYLLIVDTLLSMMNSISNPHSGKTIELS